MFFIVPYNKIEMNNFLFLLGMINDLVFKYSINQPIVYKKKLYTNGIIITISIQYQYYHDFVKRGKFSV